MRTEQFGLPISFTCKVARRGYRWTDCNNGRYLCAVDALDRPDWHGAFDQYQTLQPLLERSGLFREFAQLQPSEPHVLGFANQFGLLTEGGNVAVEAEFGRTMVHGEALQLWRDEIRALSLAVALWDAVNVNPDR